VLKDIQAAIRGIVSAQAVPGQEPTTSAPAKPLVTVSRDYGAMGDEVAERLAERLGVECYNRQILDMIADKAKVNAELMAELDEKVSGMRDAWLYALISGQGAFPANYMRHLTNVVLGLMRSGGVVVGRGAHVILSGKGALRTRVAGSVEVCARRVAEREGIDLDSARAKVEEIQHERSAFVWKAYKSRLNDATAFDLTLCSDRFDGPDAIVEVILKTMSVTGLGAGAS